MHGVHASPTPESLGDAPPPLSNASKILTSVYTGWASGTRRHCVPRGATMPPPPTRARADAQGLSFDEKREVLRRRKDVNKGGQAALPVGARALRARIAADASVEREAKRALRPKKRPKANEEYSSVKGCMVWVFMIGSCVVYQSWKQGNFRFLTKRPEMQDSKWISGAAGDGFLLVDANSVPVADTRPSRAISVALHARARARARARAPACALLPHADAIENWRHAPPFTLCASCICQLKIWGEWLKECGVHEVKLPELLVDAGFATVHDLADKKLGLVPLQQARLFCFPCVF